MATTAQEDSEPIRFAFVAFLRVGQQMLGAE
jgi:hypothetical protein